MAIFQKTIQGLINDVTYYARVYPINPKGAAQSELDGQVVSAIPMGGISISTLPVGTSVRFKINGMETSGIILNRGIPSGSALYDSSCDGVWVITKDIYVKRAFDSSDNDYENSDIHSYLNTTFYGMMSNKLQNIVKQVKIPYSKGTYGTQTIASGANGLSTKIFLLSGYELNWTTSNNKAFPVDGAVLEYFKGCASVDSKRIGRYNNTAVSWLLRSRVTDGSGYTWSVHVTGDYQNTVIGTTTNGVRPAFILPHDASVVPNPNPDGSYTIIE